MATLYLICGLPGAGKTTLARTMAKEKRLLHLSPDEWIARLFGVRDHIDNPALADERRLRVESLQMETALQALSLGQGVILENGFWSKAERNMYREQAAAAGADSKIVYLPVSRDELWTRIQRRNKEPNAFVVSERELDSWVAVFEPPTSEELL